MSKIDGGNSGDQKHEIKIEPIADLKESFSAFLSNLQKTIDCSEEYLQEKINLLPEILQQKISPQLIISSCQWLKNSQNSKNPESLFSRIKDGTFSLFRGARFSKELTELGVCIHVTMNVRGKLLLVLDPKGKNIGKKKDPEKEKPEEKLKVIGSGHCKIVEYGLFIDGDQLLPAAVSVLKGSKAADIVKKEQAISADIIQKNKGLLIPDVIVETLAGDEYLEHGKKKNRRKKTAFAALAKGDIFEVSSRIEEKDVTTPITFADVLCIVYTMAEGCRAVHHAGYLHRDIKIENYLWLFLAANSHMINIAQLTDFEHAILQKDADSGIGTGTIACYPPEHLFFKEVHKVHSISLQELALFEKYSSPEDYKKEAEITDFIYYMFHTVLEGSSERYIKWCTDSVDEKQVEEEAKLSDHLISPEIYIEMRKTPLSQDRAQEEADKIRNMDIDKYNKKSKKLLAKFVKYEKEFNGNGKKYIGWRLGEKLKLEHKEVFNAISNYQSPIITAEKNSKSTDLWALYLEIYNLLKTLYKHSYASLSDLEKLNIKKIIDRSVSNMQEFENRQSAEDFMKFLHTEVFVPLLDMSPVQAIAGLDRIRLLLDMNPKIFKSEKAESKSMEAQTMAHLDLSLLSVPTKNSTSSKSSQSCSTSQ